CFKIILHHSINTKSYHNHNLNNSVVMLLMSIKTCNSISIKVQCQHKITLTKNLYSAIFYYAVTIANTLLYGLMCDSNC
ncbi:MAG TPA: hypothetical protein PLV81_15370, partial [Spirochaetota bacterium]|nr:hypothetical protein [Spirochaetota bacterium]